MVVLLPVSGIVQIGEMARADRYTYVSLVGIFLLSVQQVSEWLVPRFRSAARPGRFVVAIGGCVAAVLGELMLVAWAQTKTWRDSVSVFSHAVSVTKNNYVAEANLGSALFAAGDRESGIAHYNEAIRLHAPELEFHRHTGIEAELRHQLPSAIQHYSKFLTLVPWDADVHQRLGGVLLQNGDYAKALVLYNEALRYDRNAVPPRLGVARVLIAQRRFAEARGLLNRILQAEPANAEALKLLATLPE